MLKQKCSSENKIRRCPMTIFGEARRRHGQQLQKMGDEYRKVCREKFGEKAHCNITVQPMVIYVHGVSFIDESLDESDTINDISKAAIRSILWLIR